MILDTHLHNLLAQYINAHGDNIEQQRLHHLALARMKERAPQASDTQLLRLWSLVVEVFAEEA